MKLLTLETDGATLRVDLDRPLDLSIPLRFDALQPSAFGAPPASGQPLRAGEFIGNVSLGGSCNCEEYRLIPHCNGTHTECVGHVTRQRVHINDVRQGGLEPALLLSIATPLAGNCAEDSDPRPQPGDRLITAQAIDAAWQRWPWPNVAVSALILRTLPNEVSKQSRSYSAATPPPYLSRQAAQWLVDHDILHVLTDLPSLDRLDDGGLLTAHHIFWGLPPGSTDLTAAARPQATITELIFAADRIADGRYLLDLQIAAFAADAAPSRPILYPMTD
jgi:hypothetical protein